MKKKSTSQSAFFNLRVLVGLFVGLAGISLALFATAKPYPLTPAQAQQKYRVTTRSQQISPLIPPGFDCSKIRQLGIDKMENFRAGAIMIFCGQAEGGGERDEAGSSSAFSKLVHKLTAPVNFGGTDVDLVTGTETAPHIIQSETFTGANPDNPDQVLAAFNDSRCADSNNSSPFFGRMYVSWNDFNVGSGALVESFSTDNGATWSPAVTVINSATFIRNTQITGDMSGNGTLYIAGMDEGGGGFPHDDT